MINKIGKPLARLTENRRHKLLVSPAVNNRNLNLKSTITFTLAPKNEIGINLIKYVQDLMKELKELNKCKAISHSCIETQYCQDVSSSHPDL